MQKAPHVQFKEGVTSFTPKYKRRVEKAPKYQQAGGKGRPVPLISAVGWVRMVGKRDRDAGGIKLCRLQNDKVMLV